MFTNEETATKKIEKILSRLEPEAAARVAQAVAEQFALEPAGAQPQTASRPHDDDRPSFLRTEHRIQVGKELLEKERS